jgi:hypothetical protein
MGFGRSAKLRSFHKPIAANDVVSVCEHRGPQKTGARHGPRGSRGPGLAQRDRDMFMFRLGRWFEDQLIGLTIPYGLEINRGGTHMISIV